MNRIKKQYVLLLLLVYKRNNTSMQYICEVDIFVIFCEMKVRMNEFLLGIFQWNNGEMIHRRQGRATSSN